METGCQVSLDASRFRWPSDAIVLKSASSVRTGYVTGEAKEARESGR